MKEDKRYQNTLLGDYCENLVQGGITREISFLRVGTGSSMLLDNGFLTYNDLFSQIYTILGFFVVLCFISWRHCTQAQFQKFQILLDFSWFLALDLSMGRHKNQRVYFSSILKETLRRKSNNSSIISLWCERKKEGMHTKKTEKKL